MIRSRLSVMMAFASLALEPAPAWTQVQQPAPQMQRQQPQLQQQVAPGQCTSPDRVAATALSINPQNPTQGQTVTVTLTIKNVCNGTLASIPWRIYLRTVGGSNVVDLGSGVQQNVPAGASFTVTANWPATPGQSSLGGQADPGNVFQESEQSRSNNFKEYGLNVLQAMTGTAAPAGMGQLAPLPSGNLTLPGPSAPINRLPPTIGTHVGTEALAGSVYSVAGGLWSGTPAPTIAYQWQRCNASNVSCVNIAGATGNRYQLGSDDIGWTIRVSETATAGGLSQVQRSASTAVVTAVFRKPYVVDYPSWVRPTSGDSIVWLGSLDAGMARVGQLLTVNTGLWAGWPRATPTFVWQRCMNEGNPRANHQPGCHLIEGATGPTYKVASADVGSDSVTVTVYAVNDYGTADFSFLLSTRSISP